MFLQRFLFVAVALLAVAKCEDAGSYDYGTIFETVGEPVEETVAATPTPAVEDITSLRVKLNESIDCGADMKCVAYYLCSESGHVVVDGSFLIDERNDFDVPKEELPSCKSLEYCCELKNTKLPEPSNMCKTYKAPAKCGFRNTRGLGDPVKSIQGINQYAHYAEFPWLMAVSNDTAFLGGGALIHPRVVLTAAHIVKHSRNAPLTVRGGEYNTRSLEEICPQVENKVQQLIMHENYGFNNLQNDAALLILETPFMLSASINTICLPPPGTVFDGKKCVSSGWGKENFDVKERHQAFPKVVNLPVVEHNACQDMFRKTRLGEDFKLHNSFLCAGGEKGIDTCTGDGGSPLVCESEQPGHYYVAGIVAGGISCGVVNVPGFYLKVTDVRAWIDQKLLNLGFEGATLD